MITKIVTISICIFLACINVSADMSSVELEDVLAAPLGMHVDMKTNARTYYVEGINVSKAIYDEAVDNEVHPKSLTEQIADLKADVEKAKADISSLELSRVK